MKVREYWRRGLDLNAGEATGIRNARRKALRDNDIQFSRRLRCLLLVGVDRYTHSSAAAILEVSPRTVTDWVMAYVAEGIEALRTRKPPGSPSKLTKDQLQDLTNIIVSGPEAQGFDTGVWSGPLVRLLIINKYGVSYSVSWVRKLLHKLGFSFQYPKKILAKADKVAQERWIQEDYPRIKKAVDDAGDVLLFEDEVVFQQEGTVCQTWAPIGIGVEVKSEPCRRSAKVFGAIGLDGGQAKYHFKFIKDGERFNRGTFVSYLKQILRNYRSTGKKVHMILDGASYHRAAVKWAEERKDEIELHFLPPYSPDLNPAEQVWRKTKREATHNRYFPTMKSLKEALFRRFNRFQGNPKSILGLLGAWI